MNIKAFNKLNNIIGWLVFAIAAFTYLSTIEWTVSLWDCGEFVPSSYKLEICHPPGAPFFVLINRLYTMLSFGNPKMVPILVNSSSALASAFTILFLFWSITALATKIIGSKITEMEKGTAYAIIGSGIVGALAYTWSDTFWFSAVEGEVYALSSFFTAIIFWLALKWEFRADRPYNLKWMILIFYMIGVVIGVHLLGLLVIPVVILMYYFKKYDKITWKGTLISLGIGIVSLAIVQFFIIQSLLRIASNFDLMFVNSFGLPMWSGVLFFLVLLFGGLAFLINWSYKKQRMFLHIGILSFTMVVVGFSSYTLTVVRSFANPPIDMNDPEDVFSLVSYLAREQYGDTYLLTGPYYTAYQNKEGEDNYSVEDGPMQYRKAKDADGKWIFEEAGVKKIRSFHGKLNTFFPRMYSPQDNHLGGYRFWAGIKHYTDDKTGREVWEDEDPNFNFSFTKHNLRFFFTYQLNYMYWRYFAWNFIGRQNDLQGTQHEFHQGNWITGISAIDEAFDRGPQNNLPEYLAKNKARNPLYGLPFILGLIGLWYQYKKNRKDFWVVALFFFMTGLAIELYLNMPNPQPRERDYAFVGSFYVYAIWIGLGVMGIWDFLSKRMGSVQSSVIATLASLILVPGIMVAKEWDDHDRSHRYTTLDYGADYLYSCPPKAILFCNGDNDTYPLWYAQEVEGIRDDIRIINLSLLSTDWYVDEMRKPINHADALTFSLKPADILGWDYVYVEPRVASQVNFNEKEYTNVQRVFEFIKKRENHQDVGGGDKVPLFPVNKLFFEVDKQAVLANKTVPEQYAGIIKDSIKIELNRSSLLKSDVMVLDFIATNKFRNPICFSVTSGPNEYLGLGKYMVQTGLVLRLVPYESPVGLGDGQDTRMDLDATFDNVMHKFKFGGIADHDVLIDEVTGRQCNNMRGVFGRLARNLAIAGRKKDAEAVVDLCMKEIPTRNVLLNFYCVQLAEGYYRAEAYSKANKLGEELFNTLSSEMDYYGRVSLAKQQGDLNYDVQRGMYGLQSLVRMAEEFKQTEQLKKWKPKFEQLAQKFSWLRTQQ